MNRDNKVKNKVVGILYAVSVYCINSIYKLYKYRVFENICWRISYWVLPYIQDVYVISLFPLHKIYKLIVYKNKIRTRRKLPQFIVLLR